MEDVPKEGLGKGQKPVCLSCSDAPDVYVFSFGHVRKKVKMSTLLKRAGPGTIFGILTGLKDAR